MSAIEQSMIEKFRALSEDKQEEVLKFMSKLNGLQAGEAEIAGPLRMTIWERIEEIVKEVAPEAWDAVPSDGSINVDHYLYGAPKKQ